MNPLRVVAVADLHVGSRVGLADPACSTGGKGARVRSALFERWKQSTEGKWERPDVLIVNGDAVDGQNRKQGGGGSWTTDLLEQSDHAAQLLSMWNAKRIYVIRGSGYHVDANNSGLQVEELLARKLNAEEYPGQDAIPPENRERSGWEWYLHMEGVTFHVSHKIGVSKVFHYQSTPTARQMLQAKLNDRLRHELDSKLKINVILRAHAHYFNTVGYSGSQGFVLPCWKGLDEWMLGNGPLDISPDIGFLGFTVHDGSWLYEKHLWSLGEVQPAPLTRVGRERESGAGCDPTPVAGNHRGATKRGRKRTAGGAAGEATDADCGGKRNAV